MTEAGSLAGCRIVVTRPDEQAEELAGPLRGRGARVRVRPLVRIAPAADPEVLQRALGGLAAHDLVVFTSANAVRVCVRSAPAAAPWPAVACVGLATAGVARQAGLTVTLVPTEFTAEGLAAALVASGTIGGLRVLWPRGSGARPELAARLRGAGALVTDVECYRIEADGAAAVSLAAELRADPADVLVFTSPSAVHALAGAGGGEGPHAVAAIGKVTEAAAAAAGWPVQVVPAEHTVGGLVAALVAWYEQTRR